MTRLLSPLLVLAFLAGCASSSTVHPTSGSAADPGLRAQCERTGGTWQGAGVCEKTQSGGGGY
jgi:hypothetical protein